MFSPGVKLASVPRVKRPTVRNTGSSSRSSNKDKVIGRVTLTKLAMESQKVSSTLVKLTKMVQVIGAAVVGLQEARSTSSTPVQPEESDGETVATTEPGESDGKSELLNSEDAPVPEAMLVPVESTLETTRKGDQVNTYKVLTFATLSELTPLPFNPSKLQYKQYKQNVLLVFQQQGVKNYLTSEQKFIVDDILERYPKLKTGDWNSYVSRHVSDQSERFHAVLCRSVKQYYIEFDKEVQKLYPKSEYPNSDKDAFLFWTVLDKRFSRLSKHFVNGLYMQMLQFKWDGKEDPDTFKKRFLNPVEQLTDIGKTVDDNVLIAGLMNALPTGPTGMDTDRRLLQNCPESELTMNKVFETMRDWWEERKSQQKEKVIEHAKIASKFKSKPSGGSNSAKGKGKSGRSGSTKKARPPCHQFQNTGSCSYGDKCKFEHTRLSTGSGTKSTSKRNNTSEDDGELIEITGCFRDPMDNGSGTGTDTTFDMSDSDSDESTGLLACLTNGSVMSHKALNVRTNPRAFVGNANDFILDLGATRCVTMSKRLLTKTSRCEPFNMFGITQKPITITEIGIWQLTPTLRVTGVVVVPGASCNLVSFIKLLDAGLRTEFKWDRTNNRCTAIDVKKGQRVILTFERQNNLFVYTRDPDRHLEGDESTFEETEFKRKIPRKTGTSGTDARKELELARDKRGIVGSTSGKGGTSNVSGPSPSPSPHSITVTLNSNKRVSDNGAKPTSTSNKNNQSTNKNTKPTTSSQTDSDKL